MTKSIDAPIPSRTMSMEIDYADKADLIAKWEDVLDGMKNNSDAVNYDHPEWLRTKYQCCGESGP